jgi:hypothetical protein
MLIMEQSAFEVGQQNPGDWRLFIHEGNHTLAIHRRSVCAGNLSCRRRFGRVIFAGFAAFCIAPGIPRKSADRALLAEGEFKPDCFQIEIDQEKQKEKEEAAKAEISVQASAPAEGPVAVANP